MKKRFIITFAVLCVISISLALFIFSKKDEIFSKYINRSWDGATLIGHGFFGIDGNIRTNSKEAFELGYEKGIRTFEIDMLLTSDKKISLLHSWNEFYDNKKYDGEGASFEEFKNKKVLDKYTPMTFSDVVDLLKKYDDIWIVTDTKYYLDEDISKVKTEFEEIVKLADNDEKILNRLVIQIYNEKMLDTVKKMYPFENIIFTLYNIWNGNIDDFEKYAKFTYDNKLVGLTIPEYHFNDKVMNIAKKYNIDLYLHTIDDIKNAKKYLSAGVRGLYTDTIVESDLK